MKDLLFLIPSYIKDSKSLLSELQELRIPSNAKLFTADATAMYSNINTDTGIKAFENLLRYTRIIFLETSRKNYS